MLSAYCRNCYILLLPSSSLSLNLTKNHSMVPAIRSSYNMNFSSEAYQRYIHALTSLYPDALQFRVAETPIFVDKAFTKKMLNACESIVDVITGYNFKILTAHAIP